MTYGSLKFLVKGLLIGDNVLPADDNIVKALLSYSFNMISNKAESMHLLTLDANDDISRLSYGDYMSRKPTLPISDGDELDIDDELGFVAARYVASLVSKDKAQMHEAKADGMILDYNAKVYQVMESLSINPEGVIIAYN